MLYTYAVFDSILLLDWPRFENDPENEEFYNVYLARLFWCMRNRHSKIYSGVIDGTAPMLHHTASYFVRAILLRHFEKRHVYLFRSKTFRDLITRREDLLIYQKVSLRSLRRKGFVETSVSAQATLGRSMERTSTTSQCCVLTKFISSAWHTCTPHAFEPSTHGFMRHDFDFPFPSFVHNMWKFSNAFTKRLLLLYE